MEGESKEGDILRGIDVPHVIKLVRAGDVLDHRTITQDLVKEPWRARFNRADCGRTGTTACY